MPGFVRFAPGVRALLVTAWCSGAAVTAGAQSAPATASHSTPAVVVVLPARGDSVSSSRIARAVAGHEIAAVYTTDSPVAYRFAKAVHTAFGGSLIPYDRLSRSADEFAGLLFHNAVEYAARQQPGQAVLVVAEPELTLPFVRRTTRLGTAGKELDDAQADGFVIATASDGTRSVTRLP